MGDMRELFDDLKQAKQERHQKWFDKNMAIILGMTFIFKDTVCLFRETGKPKVDFYPHTGRWKVKNKMYNGGGQSFKNWYNKQ